MSEIPVLAIIVSEKRPAVACVQVVNEEGACIKKEVCFHDLIAILNNGLTMEKQMLPVGSLPDGYFNGSISAREDCTFETVLVIPEGIYPVTFERSEYMIPYPACVFYFQAESGKMTVSKCYCVKEAHEHVTDETRLCYFPFGNVYNDGRICWGANKHADVTRMKDFEKSVMLFYGSPGNTDLYSRDSRLSDEAPEYASSLRAVYENLNGKKEFPVQWLKACGQCVGQLM